MADTGATGSGEVVEVIDWTPDPTVDPPMLPIALERRTRSVGFVRYGMVWNSLEWDKIGVRHWPPGRGTSGRCVPSSHRRQSSPCEDQSYTCSSGFATVDVPSGPGCRRADLLPCNWHMTTSLSMATPNEQFNWLNASPIP